MREGDGPTAAPDPEGALGGPLSVSRETLERLAARYALPSGAAAQLRDLLEALSAEPDPPTAVSEPAAALRVHVADSLSGLEVAALRDAERIADLGAGAGFPGLVLAIAVPAARVDLIESVRRKAATIDRLVQAAHITNARAVVTRAEAWGAQPPVVGGGREAYGVVTARALAPLAVLAEYAAPLLTEGGVLVAWKGGRDAEEERGGSAAVRRLGLTVEGVMRVEPFEGAEQRHLHVIRKTGPTPSGIPRRPGVARKRPLG
jgi:16S rRNA (guanine527-N7)-methyltransferase